MGYSLDLYYNETPASYIAKFPHNFKTVVVNIYSDSALTTSIGTISFKEEIASQSSESNPNIQHSIIATLSLDNGNIIIYSYLRVGSQTVQPNIIYVTEKFGKAKKVIREYINDITRKITLIY